MCVCVCVCVLFLLSIISNTEINIFIFKCTNLKVFYRITLIVLVIGKAQFRRAMLSCESCFYSVIEKNITSAHSLALHVQSVRRV